MKSVAIVGVGLIGGSFARAIRRAGFTGEIIGVSSPSTLEQALELRIVDTGLSLEQACRQADLIYLSQPIQRIIEIIPTLDALVRPDALITDAGSTKARIVETARLTLHKARFLGGHPMAGKEIHGASAADAELFVDRPYILTPANPADLDAPLVAEFVSWVKAIGARPVVLRPDQHDLAVAYASHLPQLVSTALAATIQNIGELPSISGPGVLDMTRLALSPIGVWRDIFVTNDANIGQALDDLIAKLLTIKTNLTSPEMDATFLAAAQSAQRLRAK